jgi:hypothetical protein
VRSYIKKSDHKDLFVIARYLAEQGHCVQITTSIHFKDPLYDEVFGKLKGTKYYRKCPDFIIDSEFYEYESFVPPFNKRKIGNMIARGVKQYPFLIVNNNKGASDRYIKKIITNHIKIGDDIKKVWLYEKGRIRLFYKKQ